MMTETPSYTLSAPMFISSRLMPAVKIGDGTLSAQAHAIENDGRAHFRFHLDVPGVGTWMSPDSYVTTLGQTWSHAVATALEVFTDVAGTDDPADNSIAGDLPDPLSAWLLSHAMEMYSCREELEEWLGANTD